jgi:hypothetical protein
MSGVRTTGYNADGLAFQDNRDKVPSESVAQRDAARRREDNGSIRKEI